MSRDPFAPFLHFIRSRRRAADADADLLCRFAADRDEDAFAELVRRHGPLVWGVARQVLGHDQDAEDAFQATFLLLARKAGSVHSDAIAGWLHGAAWRVATKARARAVVCHRHEQSIRPRTTGEPVAEVSLRELQAILHAEVAALPAKYRTPFVLCVLEGRGRAEVARSLGWNEGTLSTRLAWARQRLRSRLLRRGVDVAAALAAVEVTRGAVPAALAASAVTAARTGVVSATVAALAHGGIMTTKFAPLAALGLVLGVIATGSAGLMGSDPPAAADTPKDKPPIRAAAQPLPAPVKKSLTCPVTVSGTATGPDGKPVAGATVLLMVANGSLSKRIATATSDQQGRYEIRDAMIRVDDPSAEKQFLPLQVSGTGNGFAFTWHEIKRVEVRHSALTGDLPGASPFSADPQTMNLVFARPSQVHGRIHDAQGGPIVGAEVRLDFCASARLGPGVEDTSFHTIMAGALPRSVTTATTDREGRFRLDGLPDIIGRFKITHPDYTDAGLYAANVEPTADAVHRFGSLPGDSIWTGDIDPTLTRPRAIPVRVLDGVTGKPVRTVLASCFTFGRVRYYFHGDTDVDGRVTLRMPPGTCEFQIGSSWTQLPPAGRGYVWHRETITVTDAAEQPKEVRLMPVCSLEAEAFDAATGLPLAGVNFGSRDRLTPGPGNGPTFFSPTSLLQVKSTDTNGRVTLAIAPGQCRVWAALVGYETVKGPTEPVEFPAGGEVKLRFELRKQ